MTSFPRASITLAPSVDVKFAPIALTDTRRHQHVIQSINQSINRSQNISIPRPQFSIKFGKRFYLLGS